MKLTSKNLFQMPRPTVSNEVFGLFSKLPKLAGEKSDIKVLQGTLLDDNWLSQQKLSTGSVSFSKGTFISKDYASSFKDMLGAYTKCITTNLASIKTFAGSLKPFEQFINSNPKGTSPELLAKAKALKAPKLLDTPVGKTVEVPKPDKAGLKALAQVYVAILSDRTNMESVEATIDALTTDWYGANSTYRRKTEHDSHGDLIARAVAGAIEMIGNDVEVIEYQSNEGIDRAKKSLLEDIIKVFKATL